jgi:RNA polymerase sigma factor (TIGR02999 family)
MMLRPMEDLTRMLGATGRADGEAARQLLPLVYGELKRLAAQRLKREAPGQTLQATALVHEAYLRLVGPDGSGGSEWNGRAHFFAAAAEAMRRILIDNARRRAAEKHGGGRERVDLDDVVTPAKAPGDDLIALDEALTKLEREDGPKAALVKLHYFGGLSLEEAAAALGISRATAYRHWTYARAWLFQQVTGANQKPKS